MKNRVLRTNPESNTVVSAVCTCFRAARGAITSDKDHQGTSGVGYLVVSSLQKASFPIVCCLVPRAIPST